MIQGVGHIGILVRNLDESIRIYQDLLGATLLEIKTVEEQGVRVGMLEFPAGPHVELLEPLPHSRMADVLEKRGEGVQHIAFNVDDIDIELARLREKAVRLIDQSPRRGVQGMVAFLHPRAIGGVLIELCQKEQAR